MDEKKIKPIKGVMTVDGVAQIDYAAIDPTTIPPLDDTVIEGSTNAVQGGAVYTELAKKLNTTAKAADSALFNGQAPEYYVSTDDLQQFVKDMGLETEDGTNAIANLGVLLNSKLGKDEKAKSAADSDKLGGKEPSHYATAVEIQDVKDTTQRIAVTAENAMPKTGGKFTGDVKFTVEGKEVWLSFTDEENNPTDEPWIHWYIEEESEQGE